MEQKVELELSRKNISEADYLSFLINWAVDNQFALAVWRLPADDKRHLIISRTETLLDPDRPLEDLPTGFMFAPFDAASDRLYLKADLAFTFSGDLLQSPQDPTEILSVALLQEEWSKKHDVSKKIHIREGAPLSSDKVAFMSLISEAISEIEKGTFEKIVPSRTEVRDLDPNFDIVRSFHLLCDANPHALVSFVSSPQAGSWLGATPELLVSVENRNTFKTIALAGTQEYHGQNLKAVPWTQKDIEEQALVERYIISCFKKIRLREFEEHGPKTVVAGNLLHLKSEFKVDMVATNFPQLGSVMLKLLHPTAAVCGTPLETAIEFLKLKEGYDRRYYSGYLGPVNFQQDICIFVNLRCAQLTNGKAILYAGAGVTIDSLPEQEWLETDMKLNTLRASLNKPVK